MVYSYSCSILWGSGPFRQLKKCCAEVVAGCLLSSSECQEFQLTPLRYMLDNSTNVPNSLLTFAETTEAMNCPLCLHCSHSSAHNLSNAQQRTRQDQLPTDHNSQRKVCNAQRIFCFAPPSMPAFHPDIQTFSVTRCLSEIAVSDTSNLRCLPHCAGATFRWHSQRVHVGIWYILRA